MKDGLEFQKYKRETPAYEPVEDRLLHFNQFEKEVKEEDKQIQASRCMDCGVPFCHSGCPLGNKIPDFNEAVHEGEWKLAYEILDSTNNFPEFTGRICPAPCESSCVLGINAEAVAIEFIEKSIIEKAFEEGWVKPKKDIIRTGKKVAVVGSGPAGLAAADELNKAGHSVVVYEKNRKPGGLLRYGIPDFKLEKNIIDRRIDLLESEGIEFICNTDIGVDKNAKDLLEKVDALILCGGSSVPRDLSIPGRELKGVHFAMDFLSATNKKVSNEKVDYSAFDLKDKNILVIGGGDTGSDCIGTSNRLGAKSVTQIELLPKPALERTIHDPWPNWPMVLRTSSSHEEGCEREWSISTKKFVSEDGVNLSGVEVVELAMELDQSGKLSMVEQAGSSRIIPCDYVFLAIGFLHPMLDGLLEQLGIQLDERNNVNCDNYRTSIPKVFAAGDMRRGQSLVVWAIAEGREAAKTIDEELMGNQATIASNFESVLSI